MTKDAHRYAERAFAFLDILGFKDVMRELDGKPDLFEKVKVALEYALRVETVNIKEIVPGYRPSKLEVIAFSDCIVISAPQAELFSVVLRAKMVFGNMLAMGFLCRGGITIGSGFHQERIVFGQGFIDAYELEESVAVYPRIVVSDEASSVLRQKTAAQKIKIQILKQDADGCWIIDIFCPPYPGHVDFERERFLRAAQKTITDGGTNEKLGIAAKYRWLAYQFNAFIDGGGPDLQVFRIVSDSLCDGAHID